MKIDNHAKSAAHISRSNSQFHTASEKPRRNLKGANEAYLMQQPNTSGS